MTQSTKSSPPPEVRAELEKSRLFKETAGKAGSRAYLAFEKHAAIDLAGAILDEATLQETGLAMSCLAGASLYRILGNGICLEAADITNADFTRAEMTEACLRGAIGPHSVFVKATLNRADLGSGIFSGANFRGAVCLDARFVNSDLAGADFSRALISGADFSGASLAGADFSDAALSTTTRFAGVQGLDRVIAPRLFVGDQAYEGTAVKEALFALAAQSPALGPT